MAKETNGTDQWKVGGFTFASEGDAMIARKEQSEVAYLEKRMRYDKPEVVLAVYNKAIDSGLFHTPVGLSYLQGIREYLADKGLMNQAKDIPLQQSFTYEVSDRMKRRQARERVAPSAYNGLKARIAISVAANIVLLIAVIAMFVMAVTSDNPNALNYERALLNKYSEWEQDLKDREKVIRDMERELSIQSPAFSKGDMPVVVE